MRTQYPPPAEEFQTHCQALGHTLIGSLPLTSRTRTRVRCSAGHEFKTSVQTLRGARQRQSRSGGCPVCKGLNQQLRLGGESSQDRFQTLCRELNLKILTEPPRTKQIKSLVRCAERHEFETSVDYLLRARSKGTNGCRRCRISEHSEKARLKFLKRLDQLGFEPLEPYRNARSKIKIRDKKTGQLNRLSALDFSYNYKSMWLRPPDRTRTLAEYQRDIKKYKDYRVLAIVDEKSKKLRIECEAGHQYEAQWNTVIFYNCAQCGQHGTSVAEQDVLGFIKTLMPPEMVISHRQRFENSAELDIYLPNQNIGIEYCGIYYHSDIYRTPQYHMEKTQYFARRGIRVLTLWEDFWRKRNAVSRELIQYFIKPSDVKDRPIRQSHPASFMLKFDQTIPLTRYSEAIEGTWWELPGLFLKETDTEIEVFFYGPFNPQTLKNFLSKTKKKLYWDLCYPDILEGNGLFVSPDTFIVNGNRRVLARQTPLDLTLPVLYNCGYREYG